MSPIVAPLIALGIGAGVGMIFVLSRRLEKKRVEALAQVAGDLRLVFTPEGDETLMSGHGSFHLFSQGHSKKIKNLMRGTVGDLNVALFDYEYTVGGGKHRHTLSQTVISLQLRGRMLPAFSMRPEQVWHKVGSMMGYQDIDFESNPDFSKKYLLRGRDEAAVRSIFTNRVLMFFESEPGLCVEAEGRTLVVYRHSAKVKPEAFRAFLDTGVHVAGFFER